MLSVKRLYDCPKLGYLNNKASDLPQMLHNTTLFFNFLVYPDGYPGFTVDPNVFTTSYYFGICLVISVGTT